MVLIKGLIITSLNWTGSVFCATQQRSSRGRDEEEDEVSSRWTPWLSSGRASPRLKWQRCPFEGWDWVLSFLVAPLTFSCSPETTGNRQLIEMCFSIVGLGQEFSFCLQCLVAEMRLLGDIASKYRLFLDSDHYNIVSYALLMYSLCALLVRRNGWKYLQNVLTINVSRDRASCAVEAPVILALICWT